jgi:hemolysin activation/secretion protein
MNSLHRTGTMPAFSALALVLLQIGAPQAAPVAPDAGQTLRELQQQPALPATQAIPPLRIEGAAEGARAGDVRFLVKSFRISGNTAIPTAALHALVADLVGGQQSLAELNAAVARITAYYRDRGYTVARAYLPAQEIKDGVVAIDVVEGRIDQRRLRNRSGLSDERINAYLDQARGGDVIRSAQVDRGLLLLNDTPGVGSARATLQPGASVGTSDLLVELDPAARYAGNLSLDNQGNRYTGQYRLAGALYVNSPLNIGDQIALNALTSDEDLTFGRLAYQLPVGSDGLRLGAAYFQTRYRLGREFAALDAHGRATSSSVFAVYPFIRSRLGNLSGTFTWEEKRLTDQVDATASVTEKAVRLSNLGLSGNHQDTLGGGGISSLDLSVAFGRLEISSPGALAIDAASARSDGVYTRFSYGAARLQRLSRSNFLSLGLSGQRASKNLDSSEKFSLGGAHGVRAYPQGEGIGDEGYLAQLELRHDFTNTLQGTLFYDAGSVTINRNPFGAAAPNSRTLSGAGVGVNAALAGVQLRASLAWRAGGGQPTSMPASAADSPTLWVQARVVF